MMVFQGRIKPGSIGGIAIARALDLSKINFRIVANIETEVHSPNAGI